MSGILQKLLHLRGFDVSFKAFPFLTGKWRQFDTSDAKIKLP